MENEQKVNNVLSLNGDFVKVPTAEAKEDKFLAVLQDSQDNGTILEGVVTARKSLSAKNVPNDVATMVIEKGEENWDIHIPYNQIGADITYSPDHSQASSIINALQKRIGSKVEFVITKIIPSKKIAIASRQKAMDIKKEKYYFENDDKFQIREGTRCEANVVVANRNSIFVEVFGVEVKINRSEVSHTPIPDLVKKYPAGSIVTVVITKMTKDPETKAVELEVSMKALEENGIKEKIGKLSVGTSLQGVITGQIVNEKKKVSYFVKLSGTGLSILCTEPKDKTPLVVGSVVTVGITRINPDDQRVFGIIKNVQPV